MQSTESTQSTTRVPAAVIDERQHAARQYRIITADEEIIQQTGEQIVRACQLQMSASAWKQNFALAVDHVFQWCRQRSDRVALSLVSLRSDKSVFYLVPASEQFDFDSGMEQADLDIFLNTRGGIGYAETRQVPGWELDLFVENAYRVYPRD